MKKTWPCSHEAYNLIKKIKFDKLFNSRGITALTEHTAGANLKKKQLIVL